MTTKTREKAPEQFANLDAERAVLASAMIDPGTAERLPSMLQASDYYSERHRWTHDAICAVVAAGASPDILSVADELERRGQLDTVGGHVFLASLDTPTSLYADHYAAIITRHAWLRRFLAMAQKSVQMAYDEPHPDTLYAFVQEQIGELGGASKRSDITMTWEESFERQIDMLDESQHESDQRFRWPWDTWNGILSPAEPGMVVEIVADTGVGKTIYAECLADFWAAQGAKVGFLHFELNPKVMLQRRLCRWTGLDLREVKAPNKTSDAWDRIFMVNERLEKWKGRIDYAHTAGMHIDATVREMERMVQVYGTEVFILDHLKKLHRHASPRQMQQRLNEVGRQADNVEQFKSACERLNVRGVVLNHYNKTGKALPGAATKTDIAGAGEQADFVNVIVLLNRGFARGIETDPYTGKVAVRPGERSNIVEVKIDKNTMGAEGRLKQWMQPAQFKVIDRQFERVSFEEDSE